VPLLLDQLGPCPVCGAAVAVSGPLYRRHLDWHTATGTDYAGALEETMRLPPIGETVRRRPPVPPPAEVRELKGSELLRALARELDREDLEELDREDQGDDDVRARAAEFDRQAIAGMRERAERGAACAWTNPEPAATWPLSCDFPDGPCRGYGSPGCAMKAQES
jgi:hypothetical protein